MDFLAGLTGALGTAYNLFTNKRDFDYQKALQQQIFQREDTAVQRRMADLEAAGLNPNLAAGSAAGAGAAVTRSQTNDINVGNALDTIQALNNIRQQREAVNAAKIQNNILQSQSNVQNMNETLAKADIFNKLGLPYGIIADLDKDSNLVFNFKFSKDLNDRRQLSNDMPLYKLFDYNLQTQKNSADLLQKDLDFYDASQIAGMLGGLIRLLK